MAYLAPDLVRQILEGRHARSLTLEQLIDTPPPTDWALQRQLVTGHRETSRFFGCKFRFPIVPPRERAPIWPFPLESKAEPGLGDCPET